MAQTQIQKVRSWHEAIVDLMIEHPYITQGEIAQYLEKSESWVSQIVNSDVFIAYKEGRMRDHHANVSETTIEKVEKLANKSLDKLHERVDNLEGEFPIGPVLETSEMCLRSMGFGPRGNNGGGGTTVNIGIASRDLLNEAREDWRNKQRQVSSGGNQEEKPQIEYDGEVVGD